MTAQAQASFTTWQFVKEVGFDANGRSLNATFQISGLNPTTGLPQPQTLTVPLLTLLPVPYLRVRAADCLIRTIKLLRH